MRKIELVALLSLSSWCLVIVVLLFLTVPWDCLQFVIVVFPDHTYFFLCRVSVNGDVVQKVQRHDLKNVHAVR